MNCLSSHNSCFSPSCDDHIVSSTEQTGSWRMWVGSQQKKMKNVDAKWNVACLIFSADVHIISVKSHLTTTEESNGTTLQCCSCAFCQNSIVMCKTFFVKWNKTSTVPLHVDRHVCFCALWFLVSGETVSVVCCVILIRVKIFKRNCLLVYCMTRQQTL